MSQETVLVFVITVTVKERLIRVTVFVLVDVVVTLGGVIVETSVSVAEGNVVVEADRVELYP